jgi:hypothetical protein
MAITNLSTSSLVSGVKRRRVWDQTATTDGFFQIATTTLNVAASSITFSSIPQDYTHLQIRGIARSTRTEVNSGINITMNSDTGSNYSYHGIYGSGSSAASYSGASQTAMYSGGILAASSTASCFSPIVIDILDYNNTNKFKTIRILSGSDQNSASFSEVGLVSGNYRSTTAVSSLTLTAAVNNLAQYSSFALYGIKG